MKTINLQVEEPAVPVQPAETIREQLDTEIETEGSGEELPEATEVSAPSPADYIDQEQLEIEQKNIRVRKK